MSKEIYRTIARMEARLIHLEEVLHNVSQYVSEMDINYKEANTELSRQVNVAINEIYTMFKELENENTSVENASVEVRDKEST